jgi:7-keto-8-aminopelargonate synthetase-like enzyme
MGTFTKSFGGMGGYIAASKDVISFLRKSCAGSSYHNSLSPVVCQQVISSFKVRIVIYDLELKKKNYDVVSYLHSLALGCDG